MKKFIVETEFLYGWENVWSSGDTGEPSYFDTYADAEAELKEFIADTVVDFESGNLEEPYDIEQYRIIEIEV